MVLFWWWTSTEGGLSGEHSHFHLVVHVLQPHNIHHLIHPLSLWQTSSHETAIVLNALLYYMLVVTFYYLSIFEELSVHSIRDRAALF